MASSGAGTRLRWPRECDFARSTEAILGGDELCCQIRQLPCSSFGPAMTDLSHIDESTGDVRMVDVGGKALTRRRAVARATVRMAEETAARLRGLPKGDAFATAQVAGIMAAKRTSELIPLCHPLPLSVVDVRLTVVGAGVEIEATAETTAQTGVEMEALTAASVAALTVYDMAKAIDKDMAITDVVLVEKTKSPAP